MWITYGFPSADHSKSFLSLPNRSTQRSNLSFQQLTLIVNWSLNPDNDGIVSYWELKFYCCVEPVGSKKCQEKKVKNVYYDFLTSYPFKEGPTRTTGRIEGTTSYGGMCSVWESGEKVFSIQFLYKANSSYRFIYWNYQLWHQGRRDLKFSF